MNCWMKDLKDTKYIRQISIAGTHDSCARIGTASFKADLLMSSFIYTQKWTIEEQLNKGIRFFDIRIRHVGSSFTIHHGPVFLKQYFGDVMNIFCNFLSLNITEFILVRVKEDHNPMTNMSTMFTFSKVMKNYIENMKDYVYVVKEEFVDNPTVKECRGKIVFLPDNLQILDIGLYYSNTFIIHDAYSYTDTHTKNNGIKKSLDQCKTNHSVITYLSGVGNWMYSIVNVAKKSNEFTLQYIKALPKGGNYVGIIVCDYPSQDLVKSIIDTNEFI